MCQSSYVTEMVGETKDLRVTQVVDVNNCREKAAQYTGMAMAALDNVSRQVWPIPEQNRHFTRFQSASRVVSVCALRKESLWCQR